MVQVFQQRKTAEASDWDLTPSYALCRKTVCSLLYISQEFWKSFNFSAKVLRVWIIFIFLFYVWAATALRFHIKVYKMSFTSAFFFSQQILSIISKALCDSLPMLLT